MHHLPRALRLRLRHQPPSTPILQALRRERTFTTLPRRKRPQTVYTSSGDPVRYQSVRFKSPPFLTWRRAGTVILYTTVVGLYLNFILRHLDVEIEILDDEELTEEEKAFANSPRGQEVPGGVEVEEGDEYAESDSTFIPLTWSRKLPRTFYKGSDPEWQEFVKIARDKPRHARIQNELVQIVFTGCSNHPAIARQLGKDAKVGKYWLDISFPDAPPQEYERSGIEIGDGFVAWSKEKVDAERQWRVSRALWPRAAVEGLWAMGKVMAGIQYRRVREALGLEAGQPGGVEAQYQKMFELMEKREQSRRGVGKGTQTSPPEGSVVSAEEASSSPAAPTSSSGPPALPTKPSPSPSDPNRPWHLPNISLPQSLTTQNPNAPPSSDLPIAMHVFSATLKKAWNPKKMEPPRGTFVVQGLVEVKGARGRMLFDVQSCYDPKQSKYVGVNASLRGYKRWNQSPKGGP